jgi:hypothetical protein
LTGNTACTYDEGGTGFAAQEVGIYHWTAEYSGDTYNNPSASMCEDEPVVIECDTNTVTIPEPETGTLGTVLHDCATVESADGCNPTGTVTFMLFAPGDPGCSGNPVYTETVTLTNNTACTYDEGGSGYAAQEAGTYHWTAEYSGDTYNSPSASLCEDEPVIITGFEVCRTPGFWATHACPETCPGDYDMYCEKSNSNNVTQSVINAGGGSIEVCGYLITNTVGTREEGKGKDKIEIISSDPESVLEAMCVNIQGELKLQLIRHLTAAALNCIVSNCSSDCTGTSIEQMFKECNAVCQDDPNATLTVEECVYAIDCWNNGGKPELIDSVWYCNPMYPSCHESMLGMCEGGEYFCTEGNTTLTPEGVRICEDGSECLPTGPAGSSNACSSARANDCTLLDGECELNESCP